MSDNDYSFLMSMLSIESDENHHPSVYFDNHIADGDSLVLLCLDQELFRVTEGT